MRFHFVTFVSAVALTAIALEGCGGSQGSQTLPVSHSKSAAVFAQGCVPPDVGPSPPPLLLGSVRHKQMAVQPSGPCNAPPPDASTVTPMDTQQLDLNSVVPSDHALAGATVVTASQRQYLFPANAVVTRYGSYDVVRGYDSLWVFPAQGTTFRTLSSSVGTDGSTFAAESNATVTQALATNAPRTSAPASDTCPDCSFSITTTIDSVGINAEPAPPDLTTLPSGATTCDTSTSACGFGYTDPATPPASTYAVQTTSAPAPGQTTGGGSCLIPGTAFSPDLNACVPSSGVAPASAKRNTKTWKSGFAQDYTWAIHNRVATLATRLPPLYVHDLFWYGFYADVWGRFASGAGSFYAGNYNGFDLSVRNALPWSTMGVSFYTIPGYAYLGSGSATWARWIW